MKFELLGKKIGMTQVFDEVSNHQIPVTVVEVGPCPVTQIKTKDNDGYSAVQIGYGETKEARLSKPRIGHLKKSGSAPVQQLVEFRTEEGSDFKVGEVLTVDRFEGLKKVDVIGTTKGKGFQGVMKRYNFKGGPASHGSMFHRRGGSYGLCQWPGRIFKNKKMPGRMGGVQRTIQNLEVVKIIADKNIILVKGSFPGSKGSVIRIRPAVKTKK
tara:strand:+ start:732 stop:1370 length:639 start_codon:yes stop_codon:yes gene_type:complete